MFKTKFKSESFTISTQEIQLFEKKFWVKLAHLRIEVTRKLNIFI